jgi:Ca-activated chloride channel family protein
MMVVTPGDDLQPISEGRDWVFVLDISGSMSGKYATLADGVQRALGKLNPQDRFRIILFNRNARELTPGYVNASAEAVNRYSREVAAVQPGENTNLYAGLKMGIDGLDSDRSGGILLVTDGVANVGETEQRRFLSLLERTDVRLFTFVMGNSANRPLLDAMTNASGGFAIQVSNADDIVGQILTAVSKLTHQALHGVELSIEGVKTADITPARIGSLYRGQQLVMMGHYWGDGEAQVELRGKISGEAKRYQTRFHFPAQAEENPELERLWAYASIQGLQAEIDRFGEKADLKQAATDLALEYGLVTNHTSMIVVREEQFAAHGIERNNQQRVARERAAQQQRAGAPIQSNRVDTAQPMYSAPRASHGGGGSGAVSPWLVLLLLALVPFYRRSEGER